MKKKVLCMCALLVLFVGQFFVFAQAANGNALLPGLEAYAREDWVSAILHFKKLTSDKRSASSDALYWLVLSEMSAKDYEAALLDANTYAAQYGTTARAADIAYQKGRALYQMQRYDESIEVFYDFVKQNPSHDMVSSALFWIAESLYAYKNYERAALFYRTVLDEYPTSPKIEACTYRLELIARTAREEELLQLLKVTHEESLRAAEEYDKKSRNYEQAIQAYQKRIAELEAQSVK